MVKIKKYFMFYYTFCKVHFGTFLHFRIGTGQIINAPNIKRVRKIGGKVVSLL